MELTRLSLIFSMVAMASFHVSVAQNSPQDYVDAHNAARAEVGDVPITWNKTLEDIATKKAQDRIASCNLIQEMFTESIAQASYPITGAEAVKLWILEKSYYDYDLNNCVGTNCLHYTQVVWNTSVTVGCARARCDAGFWFVSCSYYPKGNFPLQRPYIRR